MTDNYIKVLSKINTIQANMNIFINQNNDND